MRNISLLVIAFVMLIGAPASGQSLARLDLEADGTAYIWAAHEWSVGFTGEMIVSTAKTAEIDLGWTFRPTPELTLLAFGGVLFEERTLALMPLVIGLLEVDGWYAEAWAVGTLRPDDLSTSSIYVRGFLTWAAIGGLGPWVEGTIGNESTAEVGGIWAYKKDPAAVQLSAGVTFPDDKLTYRLTLLYFF